MTSVAKGHKISIVTVCYNAAKDIEETIKSILSQTYDNIEFIVIDGGSTDGTVDIIRKYADRISYWVSEPDNGIYYAMNKAIEVATGDYINFMNAGDLFFDENVLEEVFGGGKTYTEDMLYGWALFHYKGGYKRHKPAPIEVTPKHMPFCHQSSFAKTSAMKAHPFDTTFRTIADCMFLRYLYKNGGTLRNLEKYISIYDVNGFSTNCSLANFYEIALLSSLKISLWGYFKWLMEMKFRPIRYGKLRFKIAEKQKPFKYQCKREGFKQLP